MALKIVPASEPIEVKQLTVCLYAAPGLGKTSAAFTAEKPLLLDFDGGAYRSGFRKDTVQIAAWSDVAAIAATDLEPYRTVVVDTAGRALDQLTAFLMSQDPKLRNKSGALTLQGYGALKAAFTSWLRTLHTFGKDVVLIAHSDEQRNGDDVIERLDVQGGSKGEIYKSADAMGRIYIENGQRILNFSPTDVAFGKNPAQFPPLVIPNFGQDGAFLAGVVAKIKAHLNQQAEESQKAQSALLDWKAKFEQTTKDEKPADAFNKLMPEVEKAPTAIKANAKRLMVDVAKKAGIAFDKDAKKFVQPAAANV